MEKMGNKNFGEQACDWPSYNEHVVGKYSMH